MERNSDTDVYNICELERCNPLEKAFEIYFKNGYKTRFLQFTNDYSEKNVTNLVNTYTNQKYLGIVTWPLFGKHKYTKNESKAACDFFADYVISCRKKENKKEWKKVAKLR